MTRLLILILLLGVLFLVYWYHDKFIGAPTNTNNKDQNGDVVASGIQGSDKKITKLKFSNKNKNKPNKKKIEFIDPETESDDITFGSYDSKSDDSNDESHKHKRNNKNREDDSCDDSNDDYDEKSNMSGYSNFTLSEL